MRRTESGQEVAGPGDIDGDGHDDYQVSANRVSGAASEGGRVTLFSGATGAATYAVDGRLAKEYMGVSPSAGEDLTGDGVPDFVAGGTVRELVRVFSGADGSMWFELHGADDRRPVRRFVAVIGDQNGDGLGEVLVGEWGDEPAGPRSGSAHVFQGGAPLGTSVCASSPNSTGLAAEMTVLGSTSLAHGNLYLRAESVPNELGLFYYGSQAVQVPSATARAASAARWRGFRSSRPRCGR